MTLATTIALRGNRPITLVRLEGLPGRFDAGAAPGGDPTWDFFATRVNPTWASARAVDVLHSVPAGIDESIDLVTGATRLGAITVELTELRGETFVTGSTIDSFAYLFSYPPAAHTSIDADFMTGDTTIDVASNTGLAQHDVLWIGREAIVLGTLAAGTTWNVTTRGAFGTIETDHPASDGTEYHDDAVFTRPPFWTGRRLIVYRGDYDLDPATAANVDELWSGPIDSIEYRLDAGAPGTWVIRARSDLARLDGEIGRSLFTGTITGPMERRIALGQSGRRITAFSLLRDVRNPVSVFGAVDAGGFLHVTSGHDDPPFPPDVANARGVLKCGDELIEVQLVARFVPLRIFLVLRRELFGTPRQELAPGDDVLQVWPTDSDETRWADSATRKWFGSWNIGTGIFTPSSHPATILLNLLLSTGTSDLTAGGGNNDGSYSYDTLPAPQMGLGVPIDRVNVASFEAIRDDSRLAGLALDRFVMGADGRAFNAAKWIQEHILEPCGLFLFVADGQINLGVDESAYEVETVAAYGTGDLAARTRGAAEFPGYDPRLDAQIGRIEFSGARADGTPMVVDVASRVARERRVSSDRGVTVEADGFDPGDGLALALLQDRGIDLVTRYEAPPPRLTTALPEHLALLPLGTKATWELPNERVPNRRGSYGLTAADDGAWRLVARRPRPLDGVTDGTWEHLGGKRPVIGPAGSITAYAIVGAGPQYDVTINVNDFTPTVATGTVPARDSAGFAVGDYVQVVSLRRARLSDNAVTVISITTGASDVIRLSGQWTLGGVPYALTAGDCIVLARYDVGTPTANQQKYAYLAGTDDTLGGTAVAAKRYGS